MLSSLFAGDLRTPSRKRNAAVSNRPSTPGRRRLRRRNRRGGGSVLDVGKAAGALVDSELPAAAHLGGEPLPEDGLAIIAAPTTAGTGSEVTPNSVLRDLSPATKASIRGENLLPVAAIVDPQLTMSAPAQVTAHSGLDAFTQALEAFTSAGANPFTDALAVEAILRIGAWLPMAYRDTKSWPARENLALGSLFAGIALASARLGLVHGLAHPVGLLYDIPHGLACALLLPHVIELNLEAAEEKYAFCALTTSTRSSLPPWPLAQRSTTPARSPRIVFIKCPYLPKDKVEL